MSFETGYGFQNVPKDIIFALNDIALETCRKPIQILKFIKSYWNIGLPWIILYTHIFYSCKKFYNKEDTVNIFTHEKYWQIWSVNILNLKSTGKFDW